MPDQKKHYSFNHYLLRKKSRHIVDMLAYAVGVGGNIAVIPQIIKAWESDAPGLAILTWVLFIAIGFIWLAYAIQHKQKPLIVAQIVSISCNMLVVGGWIFNNIIR
jgi:uncharacterized protein with PQ loop repeat